MNTTRKDFLNGVATYRRVCLIVTLLVAYSSAGNGAEPLKVCATVPDLGRLSEAVGGDRVAVTTFAKGPQDPHFLEPRPSLVKALSYADVLVITGLDLEAGWAPVLWKNARNSNVLPGGSGFIDASIAVDLLGAPVRVVDRSMGDVHGRGNPHYLVDPVSGLRVAALLRDRFKRLRPGDASFFDERYAGFSKMLQRALVGDSLAAKYDATKLAKLHEQGKLVAFLESQGERGKLGGWLGLLAPFYGRSLVADHDFWPYFSRRFGVRVVGFFEPRPGVPPTTRHLRGLIETMRATKITGILSVTYFSPRHARFVAKSTGANIVRLAHQCGARAGTADYISMVDHNVRQLANAFGESGR